MLSVHVLFSKSGTALNLGNTMHMEAFFVLVYFALKLALRATFKKINLKEYRNINDVFFTIIFVERSFRINTFCDIIKWLDKV